MNQFLKINKFSLGQEHEFTFTNAIPWQEQILQELESNINKKEDLDPQSPASFLKSTLKIIKKNAPQFDDHIIIRGRISGHYYTPCVRCLIPCAEDLDITFKAVFLPEHFEEAPAYQDITEIFCDGDEMDLYFYHKQTIDLYEFLHEQIFLNYNTHPVHDENCKGLCPTCGFNLNYGKCMHARKQI